MRERKTKEQLEADIEAKKESVEALKARVEDDAACIRRTFSTPDGIRALKLIKDRMCYQSPVTTHGADGVLHTENLQHNAALQGMYLWLRKFMSRETLIAVEITDHSKSKGNDNV